MGRGQGERYPNPSPNPSPDPNSTPKLDPHPPQVNRYPMIVAVGAIAAGMLGVGGGMILGPIFLELGIIPQVRVRVRLRVRVRPDLP